MKHTTASATAAAATATTTTTTSITKSLEIIGSTKSLQKLILYLNMYGNI